MQVFGETLVLQQVAAPDPSFPQRVWPTLAQYVQSFVQTPVSVRQQVPDGQLLLIRQSLLDKHMLL